MSATGPPSGRRPWWRSVPGVATIATVIVVAVVVTVVLTRPDDGGGGSSAGGEVFLEPAGSSGEDPYTESTARKTTKSAVQPNVTRSVEGSDPGVYGGTPNIASCNVEKQITSLTATPDKNKAFSSVLGIETIGVPAYLRSLTPVQLLRDTRVTGHGYRNGSATTYQAVLQTGTAVLVDDRGVPRVRCACGNPLLPPVAVRGTARRTGSPWPGYRSSKVVTVARAPEPVNEFVLFAPESESWFSREKGGTGEGDKWTEPPTSQLPLPGGPTG